MSSGDNTNWISKGRVRIRDRPDPKPVNNDETLLSQTIRRTALEAQVEPEPEASLYEPKLATPCEGEL